MFRTLNATLYTTIFDFPFPFSCLRNREFFTAYLTDKTWSLFESVFFETYPSTKLWYRTISILCFLKIHSTTQANMNRLSHCAFLGKQSLAKMCVATEQGLGCQASPKLHTFNYSYASTNDNLSPMAPTSAAYGPSWPRSARLPGLSPALSHRGL